MLLWLFGIATVTLITLFSIACEVRETIRINALTRISKIVIHQLDAIKVYANERYISLNNLKQLLYFTSRHQPIFEQKFWAFPHDNLQNTLSEFASKNGFYDIFIITIHGDIIYTVKAENDLHTNLTTGHYRNTQLERVFADAMKNSDPYISDYDYYSPSRDFAKFIAQPIIDNGKIIGVVAAQLDNKKIQHVINNYSILGKTGEVVATFSHKGKMLTAAPIRNSDIQAFKHIDYLPVLSLLGKSRQAYIQDRSGKNTGVAWGYQDDFRMNLAVKIDESELLQIWYKQFISILVLFLVGTAVIIWMLMALFRSFTKPIGRLTQYASEISNGNYEIRIDDQQFDEEWKVLIRAFKKMLIDINQKMIQLYQQNLLLLKHKKEIEELNENLEDRIRVKSKKLQEYIDTVDQYVITSRTDKNGTIIYVSKAFCTISGYSQEELIGKNHRIIRHKDMPLDLFKDLWRTITAGKIWTGEIKNRKSDGSYYWVDTTISPDFESGTIVGYTAVRYDITDKKRIEELAITDSMTGLYNRRFYTKTVQEEMNRVKRHRTSMALMMLDVDNFKLYNDTYGHQAGDAVLNQVAEVLKSYTSRSGEYAFRLGGEEFGIVFSDMTSEEYLDLGNRIRKAIEALAIIHKRNSVSEYVTVSIGIAVFYPDLQMSCEELYKVADEQLYTAKDQGRNQVMISN